MQRNAVVFITVTVALVGIAVAVLFQYDQAMASQGASQQMADIDVHHQFRYDPGGRARGASQQTADVHVHAARDSAKPVVDGAQARLTSNDNGVSYRFQTRELEPGVYTLWFIAINAPENCATRPCTGKDILTRTDAVQADVTYGGGHVIGENGRGTFAGSKLAGELEDSWFDNGLTNPRGAEIHLVLHSHGSPIPELLDEMTHSLRAGCTDESVPAPYPDNARADGTPGPNSCQLYQFAIFE